jgi:hypothetical protein
MVIFLILLGGVYVNISAKNIKAPKTNKVYALANDNSKAQKIISYIGILYDINWYIITFVTNCYSLVRIGKSLLDSMMSI